MIADLPEVHYENMLFAEPWRVLLHNFVEPKSEATLTFRQHPIGVYGRPDLMIFHRRGLTIVEVKRDVIDENVVGQLCRYMGAAQWALDTEERLCQHHICIDGVLVAPRVNQRAKWSSIVEAVAGVSRASHGCEPGVRISLPLSLYEIDRDGTTQIVSHPSYPIGTDIRTREFRDAAVDAAATLWGDLKASSCIKHG